VSTRYALVTAVWPYQGLPNFLMSLATQPLGMILVVHCGVPSRMDNGIFVYHQYHDRYLMPSYFLYFANDRIDCIAAIWLLCWNHKSAQTFPLVHFRLCTFHYFYSLPFSHILTHPVFYLCILPYTCHLFPFLQSHTSRYLPIYSSLISASPQTWHFWEFCSCNYLANYEK